MQTTRTRDKLFHDAALRAHSGGRASDGDLLRISPGWTNWIYWLLIGVCAVVLSFLILGRTNEYATGVAVIRGDGRADIRAVSGGVIAEITIEPGERVTTNQPMLRLYDAQEAAELNRLDREYELQLVRSLNSPQDSAAQQQLAFMREQRQNVAARLKERYINAPQAGTVKDVRIRAGQLVTPGELLLTLEGDEEPLSVIALIPGQYRPLLRRGAPLRVELDGFKYAYQKLKVDSVAEDVIGPNEARKYLGQEISDALVLQGPVVIVKASLPARSFESGGAQYAFHDGLRGTAEIHVRSERLILTLLPSLKAAWGDSDE